MAHAILCPLPYVYAESGIKCVVNKTIRFMNMLIVANEGPWLYGSFDLQIN